MTAMPQLGQRIEVVTRPGDYWRERRIQWGQVVRVNGDGTVEVYVVHDQPECPEHEPTSPEDGTTWTMTPGREQWRDMPVCPECGPLCADLVNEGDVVAVPA